MRVLIGVWIGVAFAGGWKLPPTPDGPLTSNDPPPGGPTATPH